MESRGPEDSKNVKTSQAYFLEGFISFFEDFSLTTLRAMQGGSSYHFYDGLWYDPGGRRTHDLPCERRTR